MSLGDLVQFDAFGDFALMYWCILDLVYKYKGSPGLNKIADIVGGGSNTYRFVSLLTP